MSLNLSVVPIPLRSFTWRVTSTFSPSSERFAPIAIMSSSDTFSARAAVQGSSRPFPMMNTERVYHEKDNHYDCLYFDGSSSKTKTILLPKATSVGEQAFVNQRNLETIDLSSVETLGKQAFQDCSKLTAIDLSKVTDIPESAFSGCSVLQNVQIPRVTRIRNYGFSGTGLRTITLPETLTWIDSYAFYNCTSLQEIIIPAGVTYFGSNVFRYCTSMTRAIFLGTPSSLSSGTFDGCTALEDIYVPWEYGQKPGAPWGAANATVHYVDEGWQAEFFPEHSTK